jgi:hypothetical protein
MIRKSQLLKKYGLRLSVFASVLALPLLMAAPVANAAPASHAASAGPLNSCESGFVPLYVNLESTRYYMNAETLGDAVAMGTNNTSCWKGTAGSWSEIKDEGGNCLAWNQDLGKVVTQSCNGASYQLWFSGNWGSGGLNYQNEYYTDNNGSGYYMATLGSYVAYDTIQFDGDEWFT